MARISFTSSTEEIIGRLGGNVFQDSYFGIQLRGLAKPRNPQTQLQQLRRGDFRFLSSSWRFLSAPDKATWISAAGTIPEALRLFIGNNINLILTGIPIVSSYTPSVQPDGMEIEIVYLSDTEFTVQATGAVTVVPAGCRLLILATADRPPNHIFNNPSSYQPIVFFEEGTDFSTPQSIFTAWTNHYGVLDLDKKICLKTAVIEKDNGFRSLEFISCLISIIVMTLQQAFDASIAANDAPTMQRLEDADLHPYAILIANNDSSQGTLFEMQNQLLTFGVVDFTFGGAAVITMSGNSQMDFSSSAALYKFENVLEFADNAAAMAGGLTAGMIYRNGDLLQIVH